MSLVAGAAAWCHVTDTVPVIFDGVDPGLLGAAALGVALLLIARDERRAARRRAAEAADAPALAPSAPAAAGPPGQAAPENQDPTRSPTAPAPGSQPPERETVTAPVEHGPPYTVHFSHEVRTPITAILGYTEMLATADASPPERVAFLEAVRRNCQSLMRLAEDTLTFARIESDPTPTHEDRVRFTDLLEEPLLMARPEAAARSLTIAIRTDGAVPESVSTDAFYARQILVQLVRVAISLSSPGQLQIVSRWVDTKDARLPRLQIAVHDTNTILTPAIRTALFDPWSPRTQQHVDVLDGAGLRLAIAKRLAEKLGGLVQPGPTTEAGGCYTLDLPCRVDADTVWVEGPDLVARAKPEKRADDVYPLGGRVLVVEGASEVGWILGAMVARRGVEIETCTTAADAWDRVAGEAEAARPWSAIVVDLEDPNLDGPLLVQRLLLDDSRVPIIGVGDPGSLPAACADSLTVLPKPARGLSLYGAIRPYLQAA